MAYINPLQKQFQPYQQNGMAIAPPPPVPPTPAPTLAPPPNEIGEPADMDIKREMMGLIQTPEVQATSPAPKPASTMSALTPNAPPPSAPAPTAPHIPAPPMSAPQLNRYGTYATPEQIAESLAAG